MIMLLNLMLCDLEPKKHSPVVNDHVVELDVRIIFGNSFANVKEETVSDFHNVLKLKQYFKILLFFKNILSFRQGLKSRSE